ncbi:DUF4012 domain-containing protein [Nocardioides sp. CGMCC 1.13656]|uniref:DUF4012 domain-containing protein n=1 Tax=Nocardioides TaxID=1839 RepID=UPI0012F9D7D4|nr:DUF4012 domain-containing protein [Nocardioides sp. CGMCC 1.13656]MBA2954565.1 DUF4012 domain-containing protein [Nocardioides sp. CGMCC 1.13656]
MKRGLSWVALVLLAVVVLATGWVLWTAYQVNRDLAAAVADAAAVRESVELGDAPATEVALARLKDHSAAAAERTSGRTWSTLTHLPLGGDDARGVALTSGVVRDLAADGVAPLVAMSDTLDAIVLGDGRVDLRALEQLRQSVTTGLTAFDDANERLSAEDPSSYVAPLRSKFADLTHQVDDAADALRNADTALRVLPGMLGASRPQHYLLVFQNNAEIRATGGIPGSSALLSADDGRLSLESQSAGGTLPRRNTPVLPITGAEEALFGPQVGTFFVDANLTPDFPRAARLLAARWQEEEPGTALDGVIALDPVAMSYLLAGTGPVQAEGRTLTQENAVSELLNRPYLELTPAQQDAFFAGAARQVFDAVTGAPDSPADLIDGLVRSVRERRLLVASFDAKVRRDLAGTPIAGELATGRRGAATVDVAINDATGAKMSYYLRYAVEMSSTGCADDRQTLAGRLTMAQTIPQSEAARLPDYLTAAGHFGTEPGAQTDAVHLIAPTGGAISDVRIDGERVPVDVVDLGGRPATTLAILVSGPEPVEVTWTMTTDRRQSGDLEVRVTPGIEAGSKDVAVRTSCSAPNGS